MHLFATDSRYYELGLLIIRVGLGLIFMVHGWAKLMGGVPTWQWMGSQMGNFGITFWPVFWGFLAMLTEFGGGICLVLGLGTRIVSSALMCVMIVAIAYHITKGDSFNDAWSHPFTLLIIFCGLFLIGSGRYSLDHHFFANKYQNEIQK